MTETAAHHRMRAHLRHAAAEFAVPVVGEAVFGWRARSIGAPVRHPAGPRWLRVVSEETRWAHGEWWTGNADARAVVGIRAPRTLDVLEWELGDGLRQRAELRTHLDGTPCSDTDALRQELALPETWWAELRRSLDVLRTVPTARLRDDVPEVHRAIRDRLGLTPEIPEWETVHGDLHWANLLRPEFGILDWELWGHGPAGTDAATLYCYSLLAPRTAGRVWSTFADVLGTPSGTTAQLYVAARILNRVDMGDHPDLARPLHQVVGRCRAE